MKQVFIVVDYAVEKSIVNRDGLTMQFATLQMAQEFINQFTAPGTSFVIVPFTFAL